MIVSHSLGFFTQFLYLCGNFLVPRSPTCQLFVINLRKMEFHIESSFWHLYNIGYYICFLLLVSVFPVTLKPLMHLKLAFVQHIRHADMQFSQGQFQSMPSFFTVHVYSIFVKHDNSAILHKLVSRYSAGRQPVWSVLFAEQAMSYPVQDFASFVKNQLGTVSLFSLSKPSSVAWPFLFLCQHQALFIIKPCSII